MKPIKHFAAPALSILFFFLFNNVAVSQNSAIKKGGSIFIEQESSSTMKKKETPDLVGPLKDNFKDWGYFTIAENKEQADYVMNLNVVYARKSTLESFSITNRKSVNVETEIFDKAGKNVWKGEKLQIGEDGMIGYNLGKAAAKKLTKQLKKDLEKK